MSHEDTSADRQETSTLTMIRTILAAAATILIATAAHAHPKLLKSTPADGATTAAPKTITLQFSEKLIQRFSGIEVTMTSMPGSASHSAMKLDRVTTSFRPDGKTLIATQAEKLVPGGYRNWHAVAGDTHRIAGKFAFTVR